MNTNSYKDFLTNCKKEIGGRTITSLSMVSAQDKTREVFSSAEKVKQLASNIRLKFINSIDDNLIAFDKNFSENGGSIHWCIAYDDFLDRLNKLLIRKKITKINLFSSSFAQELGIEEYLNENRYENNSETEDCIIFTPQYGLINSGSLFLNFSSALDMQYVLSSKIKIFILPINEFLFKLEEIEIFSHLYSIYKDGVSFPYLTSIFTPSPVDKESEVHLFLIDNSRSEVMENYKARNALACIHCDACKKVCPIYNVIGYKPYDNVFSGPIANVVLPFIENVENYKHLSFSCTLCGNCSNVCPVKIPISDLINANRNFFFENKMMDIADVRFANTVKKYLLNRKTLNGSKFIKRLRLKMLTNSKILEQCSFVKTCFNKEFSLKDAK